MSGISRAVKRIVESRPLMRDAIAEGIVNFANLAEKILPKVEAESGEKAERQAVIMALRRHSESLRAKPEGIGNVFKDSEMTAKSGLCDICISKSPSAAAKVRKIHSMLDFEKGECLNLIEGNNEITIVSSQRKLAQIRKELQGERIIHVEENLVSISLCFSQDFFYTPGVIAEVSRKLAWENINIFENISTMTELIFIVKEKDAPRAFESLHSMLNEKKRAKA